MNHPPQEKGTTKKLIKLMFEGLSIIIHGSISGKISGFLKKIGLQLSIVNTSIFLTSLVFTINWVVFLNVIFQFKIFHYTFFLYFLIIFMACRTYYNKNTNHLLQMLFFLTDKEEVKKMVIRYWRLNLIFCLFLIMMELFPYF